VVDDGELIAGRYRLTSRLGSGAMGVVWQARDERLYRTVAVKQLLLPFGLSDREADEASRRAMREGRIAARLQHPHAIAVYDVVEHDGQPWLVMEYLPSMSLATVLSLQGVLLPGEVARIGSEIASALAAAHKAGIVHRDIKPGNVLLADNGTAKITDFGISHAVGDVTVTATGILAGTPAYLAPEVAQGKGAGFPSDVFSLGATLYTALEGTPPFGLNPNAIALLHQVASGEILAPRESGPLTPVLLRLLQRNPALRPTMHEVHGALAALTAGPGGFQRAPSASAQRPSLPFKPVSRPKQVRVTSATPEQTLPAHAPGAATIRPAPISPVAPTGVDATAGRPPARGDGVGWRGRRRFLAGILTIMLLAGGALVTVLISHGTVPGGTAGPTSTSTAPPPSVHASPGAPGLSSAPIPGTPGAPPDTPEQLQQSIADYYALMPRNLPMAWTRLTANYQRSHAGGFTGYQDFWSPVSRVTASDVVAQQGDAVEATIDYFFNDGRVVEERTSYQLVAEDGLWKIDSSTVRSSQAKQVS
jgi:hypothetical protein